MLLPTTSLTLSTKFLSDNFDKTSSDIDLLIGPEGGFSKEEALKLGNDGWQLKSLGKRKLRSETAAIVSLYEIVSKFS